MTRGQKLFKLSIGLRNSFERFAEQIWMPNQASYKAGKIARLLGADLTFYGSPTLFTLTSTEECFADVKCKFIQTINVCWTNF